MNPYVFIVGINDKMPMATLEINRIIDMETELKAILSLLAMYFWL